MTKITNQGYLQTGISLSDLRISVFKKTTKLNTTYVN